MSVFKKLFTDTAVYGLGSIVPRVFNFFLVPLHTRVFGPEAYGDITDAYGWMAILNVVFLFGMETAYLRFATRAGNKEEDVFRTGQTVVTLISIGMTLLLFGGYWSGWLPITFGGSSLMLYAALTLVVDAVCALPFARLRLQHKPKQFSALKIANVAILITLNLWFLSRPDPQPEKVFLANLIANACYLVFLGGMLIRWRPLLDKTLAMPMFTYAWPVMLTGLAGMTNEMFSRISIDNWLPDDFYADATADYVQGIFGANYKFAVMMSLVVQAFRMAAEPFFFSHAEQKDSPAVFARINHLFTMVATFFLMAICFNMPLLKYFIAEPYWQGLGIVPLLLLGYLFLGIYYNMSVWFKVTDRTGFGTVITAGGAVLTITLNYLLIPVMGIMGSAVVTFLCYFSMTMACYLLGQRYWPVPYTLAKDMIVVFSCYALVEFNSLYNPTEGSLAIAVGIGGTLIALGAFWLLEKDTLRRDLI
ncbi:MAG: polysaccharide biosynthesis C-terminal domain-containing protein [Bacteroidota bacterium]